MKPKPLSMREKNANLGIVINFTLVVVSRHFDWSFSQSLLFNVFLSDFVTYVLGSPSIRLSVGWSCSTPDEHVDLVFFLFHRHTCGATIPW